MDAIRTFIAVDISPESIKRAGQLIETFQSTGANVRWSDTTNMHVTLQFLGDVPSARTPAVCQAVTRAVAECSPFALQCHGTGAFPDERRPRVIWIGIDEGADELCSLQERIEDAMADLGFPRERRRYHPHLTIGRIRDGSKNLAALRESLEQNREFDGGASQIEQVVVYASFRDKSGATYRPMASIDLGG